ncbi:unnamed protein product [Sphagnum balticum]
MAGARQGSSLMGFIPKALRPTYSDIGAGVLWGGTALLGAIWVVQPFGWMKDQLFPPPKEEENVDCSGGFCSRDEEIPFTSFAVQIVQEVSVLEKKSHVKKSLFGD